MFVQLLNVLKNLVARISEAVAEKNGNIISVVTADGSDVSKRNVTVKVSNIGLKDFEELLKGAGVKILDIRETK